MALPPRVETFLNRLDEFLSTNAMQRFHREALRRYLGADDFPDPDTLAQAQAYAIHRHRDKAGRSLVDHFLEAHGTSLSPEEQAVYSRLGESTFGLFEVATLERGRGMRLRRVGTDESFQVIEASGTRQVHQGSGIFTYLVPYRDHHEMAGIALVYPREFVYVIDRTVRHDPEEALAHLSDPLWAQKQIEKQRSTPQPPENRLEAELWATQTFAELELPWTVKELQARFQKMESCTPFFREIPADALKTEEDFKRVSEALVSLWNHTPRDEFGGLTPQEQFRQGRREGRPSMPKHLAQDLMSTVQRETASQGLSDEEARNRMLKVVTARWLQEPQQSMGGRTPDEVITGEFRFKAPDLESLPPPDRPLWTPESRLDKLRTLLDADRMEGASYIACQIAHHNDPIPEKLVDTLLDGADGVVLERFWTEIAERTPDAAAKRLAGVAVKHFGLLAESDALPPVLALLARTGASDHEEIFRGLLDDDDPRVREAALEGLVRACVPESEQLVATAVGEAESSDEAARMLALCLCHGLVTTIPDAVRAFLDSLAREAEGLTPGVPGLTSALTGIGLGPALSFRVASSPLHESRSGGSESGTPTSVFLPVEDPLAARRARSVMTRKREARFRTLRERGGFPIIEFTAELVQEASRAASRENPDFADLGARLSAYAEALIDPPRIRALQELDRVLLAMQIQTVLAKAIRGHDLRVEVPRALSDRARLLELLRVDEDWLEGDPEGRAISLVSEEDLLPLVESRDLQVAANALHLLAVLNPQAYGGMACSACWQVTGDPDVPLLSLPARLKGDVFLDAAVAGLERGGGWEGWEKDLGHWLQEVGTERARACFRSNVDALVSTECLSFGVIALLRTACVIADRELALEVIRKLETSGIRPGHPGSEMDELLHLLEALCHLHDIDECPEDVVERMDASAALREREDDEEAPFSAVPLWDEDEDRAGEPPWYSAGERTEPFIRKEEKVGRNEPCPCGSGKKYKRCCGKGS